MEKLSQSIIQHSILLTHSFRKATGQDLITGEFSSPAELADQLYEAPFVLLSHGTEPDPIFNYANLTAQQLWGMPWEEFTRLPSRLSAEPVAVPERQAMLEEAKRQGYISDYHGVRISRSGQRFIIQNATLWNMYDEANRYRGQAATFLKWEFLPGKENQTDKQ